METYLRKKKNLVKDLWDSALIVIYNEMIHQSAKDPSLAPWKHRFKAMRLERLITRLGCSMTTKSDAAARH